MSTEMGDEERVACVAACPGARTVDEPCGDRNACVESEHFSPGKTALAILGVVPAVTLVVLVVYLYRASPG